MYLTRVVATALLLLAHPLRALRSCASETSYLRATLIRRLLEVICRNRSFKRRLPLEFGRTPLYVSPDAQLKYLTPRRMAFDEGLLRLAFEQVTLGTVVWDIGASIGVFSVCAAVRAGESGYVLAVEPDEWSANLLRKSASLPQNRNLRIAVLTGAAWNARGTQILTIAARGRASNALEAAGGRNQMGGARERVSVQATTLDSLLAEYPQPDLVKIDVEGAERQVLEGASRVLTEVRPRIYIEVGAALAEGITALLHAHNYALFDPSLPNWRHRQLARCVFNTLAIPC